MSDDDSIAAVDKALAHPMRIRMLRVLLAPPRCIGGAIVETVRLAQSKMSEHLRILKTAGVIIGEISGSRVCYAPNPLHQRMTHDAEQGAGAGGLLVEPGIGVGRRVVGGIGPLFVRKSISAVRLWRVGRGIGMVSASVGSG